MTATLSSRIARLGLMTLIIGGLSSLTVWLVSGQVQTVPVSARASASGKAFTETLYLPLIMNNCAPPSARLCRFGVGAGSDIASYPVNSLRTGWYIDWGATMHPARPGGIAYLPMIQLKQSGLDSYSYAPNGDVLSATIVANPGSLWLIGNEPDRRWWQDDLEPRVYAQAYHDLYYLIKSVDSTAQIAAAGIVQPTPLRLQYLDMVLNDYETRYGEPMPVDVWNIHAFILRERSCDAFPEDCWGAEIPPGITATQGMLYGIQDNDNLDIFRQNIQSFRQWMADKGYQDRPLIITEFGVQMPPDYGFPPNRVNAFMDATFSYLLTMTSTLGYPADGYRLVQRWAWYSLTDNNFNGWLFDPATKARTVFGNNYADYTAPLTATVNLAPVKLWTDPASPISSSAPVTLTLYAQIVNNGNIGTSAPALARFYNGNPNQGGVQVGSDQIVPVLDGCASSAAVHATWNNVVSGTYQVYVVVDPFNSIAETNEADNTYSTSIVVMTTPP